MSISPLILKSHQIEYETSDIPLEVIKLKYKLTEEETQGWKKRTSEEPPALIPELVDISEGPSTPSTKPAPPATQTDKDKLLEDIGSFKGNIVKYAKDMMKDADLLEVKEVKDLAAMVGNVETSLKGGGDTGVTVNVLVQNLVEKYKDDC